MTYKATTVPANLFEGIVDSIVDDAVALGYSCVESRYVYGDITWAVLKNPASLNYFGNDWHMALGYVTSTKALGMVHLFEEWNTSSKMATAYAPGAVASLTATDSGTINAGPSNLSSGWIIAAASRQMFLYNTANSGVANGEPYYYSIDADRLAMAVCNTFVPTLAWYVGAYERFLPPAVDPVPVCISRFLGTSSGTNLGPFRANSSCGAATREPAAAGLNNTNFSAGMSAVHVSGLADIAWTPAGMPDSIFGTGGNDEYTGQPLVSRVVVTGREKDSSQRGVRGLFKGLYLIPAAGISAGGTVARWTFAGNTYAATRMLGRGDDVVGSIYMEQR